MTDKFNLAATLKQSQHAVCSKVGEETVILHLENGTYYGLDPLGTRVWDLLESGMSAHEIWTKLLPKYKVPAEVLISDITAFLSDLQANDLIHSSQV